MGCCTSTKDKPDDPAFNDPPTPKPTLPLTYKDVALMYDEENNSNTLPTMGKTPDERFKMIDPRIDPYRRRIPHDRRVRFCSENRSRDGKVFGGYCPEGIKVLSYAIDAGARAELLHRAARAQQVTTFARERYLDVVMDVLWKVVRNSSSWSDDWQWRKHRLLREVELYEATIVCLQDVTHYSSHFKPGFEQKGYSGAFAGDENKSGCATWFLRSRFQLVSSFDLPFGNGNVALVTLLNKVESAENGISSLMVVNAQLGCCGNPLGCVVEHTWQDGEALGIVLIQEGDNIVVQGADSELRSPFHTLEKDLFMDPEETESEEASFEGAIVAAVNGRDARSAMLDEVRQWVDGPRPLTIRFVAHTSKHIGTEVIKDTVALFSALDLVISEKLLFKVPPLVMCVSHGVQPGSPAYSYCATGMLPEDHELANCSGHSLLLKSAYAAHGPAQEAPYTVCTEGAAATGDFIWHSELLDVASTIDMVDKASLQADGGLPSTDYSSQHVPLVATVTESRSKTKLLRTPLQVRDFNATPAPMMQI